MNAGTWDRDHLFRMRGRPLRVIDGDTFVCLLELPCYVRFEAHIRIADLNAPEWNAPGGIAATGRLRHELDALIPGWDWPLRIVSRQRETVVSEVHSFERLVADVYVVDGMQDMVDVKEHIT